MSNVKKAHYSCSISGSISGSVLFFHIDRLKRRQLELNDKVERLVSYYPWEHASAARGFDGRLDTRGCINTTMDDLRPALYLFKQLYRCQQCHNPEDRAALGISQHELQQFLTWIIENKQHGRGTTRQQVESSQLVLNIKRNILNIFRDSNAHIYTVPQKQKGEVLSAVGSACEKVAMQNKMQQLRVEPKVGDKHFDRKSLSPLKLYL